MKSLSPSRTKSSKQQLAPQAQRQTDGKEPETERAGVEKGRQTCGMKEEEEQRDEINKEMRDRLLTKKV